MIHHSFWFYIIPVTCFVVFSGLLTIPFWVALYCSIEVYRYEKDYRRRCDAVDRYNINRSPGTSPMAYPYHRPKAPWEWYQNTK